MGIGVRGVGEFPECDDVVVPGSVGPKIHLPEHVAVEDEVPLCPIRIESVGVYGVVPSCGVIWTYCPVEIVVVPRREVFIEPVRKISFALRYKWMLCI